jgi:adenosyl cobinamide kinase/adenosyl cobinamide phosphate guanylyltransferase
VEPIEAGGRDFAAGRVGDVEWQSRMAVHHCRRTR